MQTSEELKETVDNQVRQIRQRTDFIPEVALVLGSGLGALADEIETEAVIDYSDLHGFPVSTVPGHKGRFVFGKIGNIRVVIMQGRVHYYEGYAVSEVILPVRVMAGLGAEILFLTNASGGINSSFEPGDLMLITDQISFFVPSPLLGENVDEWGTRFPSMNEIYDKDLRHLIEETATECQVNLKQGVYVQTTGPQYESPAEVRMLRGLGADAVGMSTSIEAICAVHMGMRVCGISCITNMAGGSPTKAVTHDEVKATADRAAAEFKKLVTTAIGRMKEYAE